MNRKVFIFIIGVSFMSACGENILSSTNKNDVICTQEARECPDGSWVGRSGPKCEFICSDKK